MTTAAGRVTEVLQRAEFSGEIVLIHGGNTRQSRNGVIYLPWNEIQSYSWAK